MQGAGNIAAIIDKSHSAFVNQRLDTSLYRRIHGGAREPSPKAPVMALAAPEAAPPVTAVTANATRAAPASVSPWAL